MVVLDTRDVGLHPLTGADPKRVNRDGANRTPNALLGQGSHDYELKWLICYVILSRVPSLKQLISIGLSDKIREIIEGGPPEGIVQSFNTLFAEKIEKTHAAALEARRRLGW